MALGPAVAKGIGTLGRGPVLDVNRSRGPLTKGIGLLPKSPVAGINKGQAFQPQVLPRQPGIPDGNAPAKPVVHPPAPPQTPAAPGAAPAAPTGNTSLDSQYYANVAANQFKVGNDVNALNLQGSQASTALQSALGQLAYQQPRDSLKLEQSFNRRGGLYSTVEGQAQGDLAHGYLDKQNAAQQNYSSTADKIAAQIAALQGSVPLYNDTQAADSAARAAAAAAKNPALGQGTGGLNTNPVGLTTASAAPATPPRVSTAPKPPGTILRDTTTVKAPSLQQQLAQAIAHRQVVNVRPVLGKGTPRQVRNVVPTLGKGRR